LVFVTTIILECSLPVYAAAKENSRDIIKEFYVKKAKIRKINVPSAKSKSIMNKYVFSMFRCVS